MRRFLSKLLILTLLLLGLKAGLWTYLHQAQPNTSFAYEAAYKRDSLLKPIRHRVNTIFVGSSRTAFSLIPAVFDSVGRHQTVSFNHGLSAMFAPATFTECEKLLAMNGLRLETLLVELSFPHEKTYEDPFDKTASWTELRFKMACLWRENSPKSERLRRSIAMINSYLNRALLLKNPVSLLANSLTGEIDDNFVMTASGHRYFRHYTGPIRPQDTRQEQTFAVSTGYCLRHPLKERLYLDHLRRLMDDCEARNIQVYFYLPNQLTAEEESFLPTVFAAIPEQHRLHSPTWHDIARSLPGSISSDGIHLNPSGAALYSQQLAQTFREKQRRYPASSGNLALKRP